MSQYGLPNLRFVSAVVPSLNWQRVKAILSSLLISGIVLVGLFISLSQPAMAANTDLPLNPNTPDETTGLSTSRYTLPAAVHRQSGEPLPSLNVTNTLVLDEPRYGLESQVAADSFTIPLAPGVNITASDEILIIDMDGSNVGRHETATRCRGIFGFRPLCSSRQDLQ